MANLLCTQLENLLSKASMIHLLEGIVAPIDFLNGERLWTQNNIDRPVRYGMIYLLEYLYRYKRWQEKLWFQQNQLIICL